MPVLDTRPRAVIDDLYRIDGKAELIEGEVVTMAPSGDEPGSASYNVTSRLKEYQRKTKRGRAYGDNVRFRVDLPGRQSFSPDAAFYVGPRSGLSFLEGSPVFAVEVRSENDYGPAAERSMAAKRADYFAAGTKVVWDVDLRSEDAIRKFTAAGGPDRPVVLFRRGQVADAEPAVPEWTMLVDELFEE